MEHRSCDAPDRDTGYSGSNFLGDFRFVKLDDGSPSKGITVERVIYLPRKERRTHEGLCHSTPTPWRGIAWSSKNWDTPLERLLLSICFPKRGTLNLLFVSANNRFNN